MPCSVIVIGIFLFLSVHNGTAHASEHVRFRWYWMFYEQEVTGDFSATVFRPFYLRHATDRGFFEASLMPALYWRYKNDRKDSVNILLGAVRSTYYVHAQGMKDYDLMIFPFVLFGTAKEKRERYLLLWPFGGTMKGKFGYDKISAYVFPGLALFVFFPHLTLLYGTTWLAGVYTALFLVSSFLPALNT